MAAGEHPRLRFTRDGAIYAAENASIIHYQRINGIYYHMNTPASAVNALEQARASDLRIRLYYGDVQIGRDWLEEFDMEGFLANSVGPLKVPLLLENRRCIGGPALLDHCIVKIKVTGRSGVVLYEHPNYHTGTFTIREITADEEVGGVNLCRSGYTHAIDVDGSSHANFRSLRAAERFVVKMTS